MCVIHNADTHAQYLQPLRARLELEWGTIDPFEGSDVDVIVPSPLFLITEKGQLVGGLAFSSFANPNKEEASVWINALLVEPEYRGKGYASKLIQKAEAEAVKVGIPELFVLSEFSGLYRKQGWSVIQTSGSDSVLAKLL